MQSCLNALHGQVGALHHTNLDASTAACAASSRPFLEPHHRCKGVRQVGLKHDASFEVQKFRTIQNAGEHRNSDVEIFELFHVQVDELGRGALGGQVEQGEQALNHVLHILLKCPRRVRSNRGGNFDGDIVDIVTGQ